MDRLSLYHTVSHIGQILLQLNAFLLASFKGAITPFSMIEKKIVLQRYFHFKIHDQDHQDEEEDLSATFDRYDISTYLFDFQGKNYAIVTCYSFDATTQSDCIAQFISVRLYDISLQDKGVFLCDVTYLNHNSGGFLRSMEIHTNERNQQGAISNFMTAVTEFVENPALFPSKK